MKWSLMFCHIKIKGGYAQEKTGNLDPSCDIFPQAGSAKNEIGKYLYEHINNGKGSTVTFLLHNQSPVNTLNRFQTSLGLFNQQFLLSSYR